MFVILHNSFERINQDIWIDWALLTSAITHSYKNIRWMNQANWVRIRTCLIFYSCTFYFLKGILSGLRQFSATESPIKIMKNALYFTWKVLFVLKILELLSWLFDHAKKQLDWEDQVIFKIYDVTTCLTNKCNTHIDQYLKK